MGGPTLYGMVTLATSQLRTEDEAASEDEEGAEEVGSLRYPLRGSTTRQWWRSDHGAPERLRYVEG